MTIQGDPDDRKCISWYVFMMGLGAISWSSRKQSTKAEFVTATTCAFQAIWLQNIFEELHFKQEKPSHIYCDNNLAIKLSKNHVLHGKGKHILM